MVEGKEKKQNSQNLGRRVKTKIFDRKPKVRGI